VTIFIGSSKIAGSLIDTNFQFLSESLQRQLFLTASEVTDGIYLFENNVLSKLNCIWPENI